MTSIGECNSYVCGGCGGGALHRPLFTGGVNCLLVVLVVASKVVMTTG